MSSKRAVFLAVTLVLCSGTALQADTPTPDQAPNQAKAVEHQLREWLQSALGPAFPLPPRPVRLRAEGNAYRLYVPLDPALGLTGHIARQADGRWRLSDLTLPSPTHFTVTLPVPPKDGKPGTMLTTTYDVSLASQQVRGLFDPSFDTPSTLEQHYGATQIVASNRLARRAIQLGSTDSKTTLIRDSGGRFTLASAGTIDHFLSETHPLSLEADGLHVAAAQIHATSQLSGVSAGRARDLLQALVSPLPGATLLPPAAPPPFGQARLRAVIDAFKDLADSGVATETMDGLHISAGAIRTGIRHLSLGLAAKAHGGMFSAALDVEIDGLTMPFIPAAYADFVPKTLVLRPILSGIGTAELVAVLRAELDAKPHGTPDLTPLFDHGGIKIGLDALAFDLGPAHFSGHGSALFATPRTSASTMHLIATGLDALIARVQSDADLAPALAILTVAKGVGHTDGDRTAWDITETNGKILVNGLDLGAMARGSPPPKP